MSTQKRMSYGDQNALKILAVERMGFTVDLVDMAKSQLRGEKVHPMHGAAMEREACRVHNALRSDGARLPVANKHVEDLLVEYGFESLPTAPGAVASAARAARPGAH